MTKEIIMTLAEQKFREKISPTFAGKLFPIPGATLSPSERIKRMTSHRNEQYLHRGVSCFSEKSLVTVYPENFVGKICTRDEWFSDSWDGLDFDREVEFSRDFFVQYAELQADIPRAATVTLSNQNSEFSTGTAYCRNCYLINSSENCEDCMYSKLLQRCKDIVDCSYIYDSELLYECFNCENCFDSQFLENSKNCNTSWFLKNCIGCTNCFGCVNLKQKEYYFLNKKHTKEEYEQKIAKLGLDKRSARSQLQRNFAEFTQKFPHKYAEIINSENCTGDFIMNSKNCHDCYDVEKSEDCANVYVGGNNKDVYDCCNMYIKAELCLETLGVINAFNCNFCLYVFDSNDLWYSEQCFSCKDCFGCVGLCNKQYCILNKQFASKQAYEQKVAEIITHMTKTKEWGEFFPAEMSPFPYEKSVANYYFPKNSAAQKSFKIKDQATLVPDEISQTDDAISREILDCVVCAKKYKIQPAELKFYHKMNVPVPTECSDCRHEARMKLRNSRNLHARKCDNCSLEIQSTFSPEQPEKIFCETCYQEGLD